MSRNFKLNNKVKIADGMEDQRKMENNNEPNDSH
jgi:hypothetical protein